MNLTKKIKDGKVFSMYIDKAQLEHLKSVARRMSVQEGRDVSASEVIRIAVELIWPIDKQMDMFPQNKRIQRVKKTSNQASMFG